MAQVLINTIDPTNGSIGVSLHLKDKDLVRIYDAYKYEYAKHILQRKEQNNEILEASDTVENIAKKINAEEILNDLLERFMKDIINFTHNTEANIAFAEISSKVERIEVS